jgi:diaminopimelate epimerase
LKEVLSISQFNPDEAATMNLHFTKMNGAGNDFVMVDNRNLQHSLTTQHIETLCNRHRGIGADGLLAVEPCTSGKADFRMRYYNADGGEAEMCGNGSRCFARFVQKLGACRDKVTFETQAGVIRAEIEGRNVIVNLSDPGPMQLRQVVKLSSGEAKIHSINTGVPHAVLIVEDVEKAQVHALGNEIRYHPHFAPKGTNVNFVQLLEDNRIRVRTYERGVEGETLACGTGVTASALVTHALFQLPSPISVRVQSGDLLEVSFLRENDAYRAIHLKGPADFTFEGAIELKL